MKPLQINDLQNTPGFPDVVKLHNESELADTSANAAAAQHSSPVAGGWHR
jgi:hypothetical protein